MLKQVQLTIQFEHNPLFTEGQVVKTPSGDFRFLEALKQHNGSYLNLFEVVGDKNNIMELHDDKFAKWYYDKFLKIAYNRKEDGSSHTEYNNQVVYINGIKHNVVGLANQLKPKLYHDKTGKDRMSDLINTVVRMFLYQRFGVQMKELDAPTLYKTIALDGSFEEVRRNKPDVRKEEVTYEEIANPNNYENQQGSCRGCKALMFYRDEDGNAGIAQQEAQKYSCPYVCGYTMDAPSPDRVQQLREETGRGITESIAVDHVLDGCEHYVPWNAGMVKYKDKSGNQKSYPKPFYAPVKYDGKMNGVRTYTTPGFKFYLNPVK